MFYQEERDQALRFGDVLRGYLSANPNIKEPFLYPIRNNYSYNIDIEMPIFSVVLTPCCSIGDNVISLTPLIRLRSDFFKNPHFLEDFTIINREMEPEKSVPPDKWREFPVAEKERRTEEGKSYILLNLFVYEKNDLFPKYSIRGHEINYYMIDFRNIHVLKCGMIKQPEKTKSEYSPILDSKCLQLSIHARSELRDKIAYYYARMPEEDKILAD